MSDTRDDDGEASREARGDEDREATRARRRRGLRVPVDDVPRPSFVEVNVSKRDPRAEPSSPPPPPSRVSVVGAKPPSVRPPPPPSFAPDTVEVSLFDDEEPKAESPKVELPKVEATAPRRPSLVPPPPPPKRVSERPSEPQNSFAHAYEPSVIVEPEPKSAPPLAAERTVVAAPDLGTSSIELSLDDEPEVAPRETIIEEPLWSATVETRIADVLPPEPAPERAPESALAEPTDEPLPAATTAAEAPEPLAEPGAAFADETAPSIDVSSEPAELAPEPTRALFSMPMAPPPAVELEAVAPPADETPAEETPAEDSVAELAAEPTRVQAASPSQPPEARAFMPTPVDPPRRRPSSLPPAPLPRGLFAGGDSSTEQSIDDDEPVLSVGDEESAAELEAALPPEPEPAPVVAAPVAPVAVQAVVAVAPVVVLQRSVSVEGSRGEPAPRPAPPPEQTDHTTPGGFEAPSLAVDEKGPALVLDIDDPIAREAIALPPAPKVPEVDTTQSGETDAMEMVEGEILEEPIAPVPAPKPMRPPAPPPRVSNPNAPPPPIAQAAQQAPPQPVAVAIDSARPPPKKKVLWWEELFNDDYLRTVPVPPPRWVRQQCDFIEQRLGLAKGAAILDVGCGLGLHAIELTRRGYVVVGLDYSLPMLSRAADEAQDQGFKINFLHADMREMNFDGAFDAVLFWGTTLGYFDDEVNKQVIERIHRALKPGGLFLIDVVNRDYAVRTQPNLVWFQGDGCIVMEETSFNHINSRLVVKRNVILDDGRQKETQYSIRLYALHELGQVLHQRGFRVVEVSGRECMPGVFFGADSPKMMIVAERRVVPGAQPPAAPPAPPKASDSEPA